MVKKPLNVGIIIDGSRVPAWVRETLGELDRSEYADVSVIVHGRDHCDVGMGYRAYQKVEDRLFSFRPSAFETFDIEDSFPHVPALAMPPERDLEPGLHQPSPAEVEVPFFGSRRPDVLLDLRRKPARSTIVRSAEYGRWCLSCGSRPAGPDGLAGFWEVIEGDQETTLTLAQDNGSGPEVVLARSYFATDAVSVKRNQNRYYWKATSLIRRTLREFWRDGGNRLLRSDQKADCELTGTLRSSAFPSLMLRLFVRTVLRKLNWLFRKQQWILLYRLGPQDALSTSVSQLERIVPPRDRFWADPHVVLHDGTYYIFLEEFPFVANKGHISVMEMDPSGGHEGPRIVLQQNEHLSYPFVFEYRSEFYMIPETSARRRIELYRSVGFPDHWELSHILMDNIDAVDSTVIFRDGRWWLFANIREDPGAAASDELFLFHSASLFATSWIPHARNPVVADIRRARPAGPLFESHGKLFRPAQRGTPRYGYGVIIHEIITMTEDEYEERPVHFIEPDAGGDLIASHTLATVPGLTMMDGQLRRWRHLPFFDDHVAPVRTVLSDNER